MTLKINNYKKLISTVNYWFLLLFVIWLPLNDDYLPTIMTLWIFTWLLQGEFKSRFKHFQQKKYLKLQHSI